MRIGHPAPRAIAPLALLTVMIVAGCDRTATGPVESGPPRPQPARLQASAVSAELSVYTSRAAWEAAVAAAGATVQTMSFTGLPLGRITQTDTDYGSFRIVVDQVSTNTFSNPGIDIFPDAGCSLGTGDCHVLTLNMFDPASTFSGPKSNQLVFPQAVVAFGGDFIQVGVTAPPPGSVTGPVTLAVGTETVVLNDHLDAQGNGFLGVVAAVPSNTVSVTFAKSGTIQNDIFQVYNPAYAVAPAAPEPTPAERIASLRTILAALPLDGGAETSVDAKLRAALAALDTGQPALACSALQDLVNHVRAQSGKHIPAADAALLIAKATEILAALGC